MRTNFVERRGKLKDTDRSFDLKFWQAQPPKARFDASWELIVHYMKVKGRDVRQLRLQRSITHFRRPQKYSRKSDLQTSEVSKTSEVFVNETCRDGKILVEAGFRRNVREINHRDTESAEKR